MPRKTDEVEDRIIQDPDILAGKPVVRGTHIPVEPVLAKLAANPDVSELFQDYPRVTLHDIEACRRYAARTGRTVGPAR